MNTDKIIVVIDDESDWARRLTQAVERQGFHQIYSFSTYADVAGAGVIIVGANDELVGVENVSRLRVSHPEATIIVASRVLGRCPKGSTKTVGQQLLAAGADSLVDKNTYRQADLIALLPR